MERGSFGILMMRSGLFRSRERRTYGDSFACHLKHQSGARADFGALIYP